MERSLAGSHGLRMIDPNVLKAMGCDPEVYTGFAAGMGVERIAMVLQIDDIRRFYSSDLRFCSNSKSFILPLLAQLLVTTTQIRLLC